MTTETKKRAKAIFTAAAAGEEKPAPPVGYVILTMRVREEDGRYVSECTELGIASFGDTIDQAFEAIRDATALYLNTLEDEGERDRVFAEAGIDIFLGPPPIKGRPVHLTARPREYVSPETLPIALLA